MSVPRTLRYSPVNSLVVDWGFDGQAFNDCGLPQPIECPSGNNVMTECQPSTPCPPVESSSCCNPLPIQEAINVYDWLRWVPEVIVGIEDPDEEIAANYIRQAAIEFCKGGRVLQRDVVVEIERGTNVYPLFPYTGEQIVGVIGIRSQRRQDPIACRDGRGAFYDDFTWRLDTARNELHIEWPQCSSGSMCDRVHLLVWSAPTEDACYQDVFLYDRFRQDIAQAARRMYAVAVHFRDRTLLASLPAPVEFDKAIILAKKRAVSMSSGWKNQPSAAFGYPSRGPYSGRSVNRWPS